MDFNLIRWRSMDAQWGHPGIKWASDDHPSYSISPEQPAHLLASQLGGPPVKSGHHLNAIRDPHLSDGDKRFVMNRSAGATNPLYFTRTLMNLAIQHSATLARYAGISFIAGAVNHGMFSEQRSAITAGFGVLLYLAGSVLEMRLRPKEERKWKDLLGFGVFASIGLGFFTGGLQHFPDSPERSVWVVPLGFLLSLVAMYFTEVLHSGERRSFITYGLAGNLTVIAFSVAALKLLPVTAGAEHDHGHADHASATVESVSREIVVEMFDSMRYSPADWQVAQGEAVRFKIINRGSVRHEFVLGSPSELEQHAEAMLRAGSDHHGAHHGEHGARAGTAVAVEPGQSAELNWIFNKAGQFGIGCFEPGHYQAGMRGMVTVLPQALPSS